MRKFRIVATLLFSVSLAALAQEAAPQSQPSPAPRVIDLKSADGTILKGTYFAAPKPGPGAILYHQSNRTRHSWAALAAQLAAAGIHVLTIDKRGFGDSGGKSDSKEARKKWWPFDLDTAFQFLTSQPGVNNGIIGLGGAVSTKEKAGLPR